MLITFLILILCSSIGAAAETIVKQGDSIQNVINNASSGDVITIQTGTYTENIKIYTDGLTIRSASGNPDDILIKADDSTDHAIFVQADNIQISGIRVGGATAQNVAGICLSECNNSVIEKSKLTANGRGIYLLKSTGCRISENNVINNGYYGILLESSTSNTITGNTVTNSERGIYMGTSDDNTVSGNTVTLNSVLGFYSCSLCDRNLIYNNYFNNTEISIKTGSGSKFNTTKTQGTNIVGGSYIGGNYWGKPDGTGFSDTAVDNDGDGIADSAYSISSSYSDYLPLVYPSTSPEPVPPVADFSSDVTSGDAPLKVSFTDKSTGDPTTWDWDFGDGNVSTDQNPVHTYTSEGTYTVQLTVSNEDGTNSKTAIITVSEPEPVLPDADFSSDVSTGEAPLEVSFTDASTGTPTAWNWDFGDGTTSTEQNPVHTYTTAGTYTVKLTVSNADGTDSKTADITVSEPEKVLPDAEFSSDISTGEAPLDVSFTDASTGTPTAWNWNFGDGNTSTEQNPVHTYYSAGEYTVNLTVSNENGTDSKTAQITVLQATELVVPIADFSSNVTTGTAPLDVSFTDTSTGAPTSWNWDFGDGDGDDSTDQNPVHTYSSAGEYTVNLTVSNENGSTSKTAVITVQEKEEDEDENNDGLPVADFSANVTSGYYPLAVLFTDLSQNATETGWDFNDDGVVDASSSSIVYVFTSRGTYTVNLIANNENGTDTKSMTIDVKKKSSGGSSSGGGGGGGSPEPARNVETKELAQVFIINGKAIKFDFTKNATCVVYVGFDSIKNAGKTTTIVEQLKGKSTLVSELPKGEVYKSFNVWVGNSGYASSKNIENPEICFKVEKSWVQNESIDQDSIILNRYDDDEETWGQLAANLTDEDDNYLYFTSEVPGFSSFAITGTAIKQLEEESEQISAEERTVGDVQSESNETEEPESKESSKYGNILLSIGIVVGALAVVGVILKSMKE